MEKKYNLNKRAGSFLDFFFIIAILLATGICIIAAYMVADRIDESGIFDDVEEAKGAISVTKRTILNFDNIMLFIIVGLSIFVLVSSAIVFNHPGFFFVGIFLLFIAVVVAASVSNAWGVFIDAKQISEMAAAFPKLLFLMEKLPIYILFMGMGCAVAMFIGYNQE